MKKNRVRVGFSVLNYYVIISWIRQPIKIHVPAAETIYT